MEKIILVHYVNIGNIDNDKVSEIMEDIVEKCQTKEQDIISYWIPIKDGDTRIECINPKLISEEDFNECKKILDRNQKIVNDIISNDDFQKTRFFNFKKWFDLMLKSIRNRLLKNKNKKK